MSAIWMPIPPTAPASMRADAVSGSIFTTALDALRAFIFKEDGSLIL